MRPVSTYRRFVASLFGAVLLATSLRASDQPQWGEHFTRNQVSGETGLVDSFDPATGRNIRWVAQLGNETHSTPVIANGRILVGTNNGKPRDPRHQGDRGVVMCFDEDDGAFQWQLVVPKLTNSIYWDWPNAGICSTATVEGDRVYVVSNRGEVLCLDLKGLGNGNDGPYRDEARHFVPAGGAPLELSNADADILWLFDIVKECGVRQHDSAHGSILVDGPFLYVNTSNGVDDTHRHIDSPDAPSLIVVEKATGRWIGRDNERIGPRIFHSTWSSPALAEVNGERRVFFCGGDGVVYGFKALTELPPPGQVHSFERVWRFDCDPTGPKEEVHKYNSNRRISPSNIKSMPVFHDGRLYVTVGGDLWWGKNQCWLQCINPSGNGDVTSTGLLWSYPLVEHCMTTPAVQGGLVFLGDSGSTFHCVDAATGKACWTHDVQGEVWASALVADGKVYVGTRAGWFYVFAAAREKKLISAIQLGSPVSSTAVAANGVLYVTTMDRLYALTTAPDRTPDVVFIPTPMPVVEKMLAMAEVKKGDVVYDLGCGDGRIVVTAAKKYGVRGFGFDIDPARIKESVANVESNRVARLVTIKQADIFTLDLSQADVVTLYLLPRLNVRLMPQLEKLKPGSRIVSHDFDMRGAKPVQIHTMTVEERRGEDTAEVEHTIYKWVVPWEKEASTPTE